MQIQDKQYQLNDEEEGARQVNKYLNYYFGHSFLTLQAIKVEEGDAHIQFQIVREGVPAYNLSEGECSLIAFCYFMAKLNDIETKQKKPIIWIDDPISSLDGNHVFFVYSIILAEIVKKLNFSQLFLSTHNIDFLKYLQRLGAEKLLASGKNQNIEKRFFIINRHGKYSTIEKMPIYLQKYGTEYNYLFSQVYDCSMIESVNDDNIELFYNIGNIIRRFFEIHLYFKYPCPNTICAQEEKIRRFFAPDEIAAELIIRLCNENSHATVEHAQKIGELPEAVPAAKKIIEKLQEDVQQYNAFLKSIDKLPFSNH